VVLIHDMVPVILSEVCGGEHSAANPGGFVLLFQDCCGEKGLPGGGLGEIWKSWSPGKFHWGPGQTCGATGAGVQGLN